MWSSKGRSRACSTVIGLWRMRRSWIWMVGCGTAGMARSRQCSLGHPALWMTWFRNAIQGHQVPGLAASIFPNGTMKCPKALNRNPHPGKRTVYIKFSGSLADDNLKIFATPTYHCNIFLYCTFMMLFRWTICVMFKMCICSSYMQYYSWDWAETVICTCYHSGDMWCAELFRFQKSSTSMKPAVLRIWRMLKGCGWNFFCLLYWYKLPWVVHVFVYK